jgi:hypothetical protein
MIRGARYAATIVLVPVTLAMGCPFGADKFVKPCQADADCNDQNPCTDDRCAGGTCSKVPNNAVPDDGKPCTVDTCVNGEAQHTPATNGTPCGPNSPLKCDAMGNCPPCAQDTDCGTAPAGSCTEFVCNAQACTTENKVKGTACVNAAGENVCDGMGTCVGCLVNGDCSDLSNPICDLTQQKCVSCHDGIKDGNETDIDCGGPECGACQGQKCDPVRGCGGTNLNAVCVGVVCCDQACSQMCMACSMSDTGMPDGTCAPVLLGTDPKSQCVTEGGCGATPTKCRCEDGVQNGDETDVDCGGATCPACGPKKKCAQPSDCANATCADGYCCVDGTGAASACNAPCYSCGLMGAEGTCAAVPPGYQDTEPVNACAGQFNCGSNGANCVCGGLGIDCIGKAGATCVVHLDCLSDTCGGAPKVCAQSVSGDPCNSTMDCMSGLTCQNYICK